MRVDISHRRNAIIGSYLPERASIYKTADTNFVAWNETYNYQEHIR
jgi:hypothetical protein